MKRAVRFLIVLVALVAAVTMVQPQMSTSCGSWFQSDGCPTPW